MLTATRNDHDVFVKSARSGGLFAISAPILEAMLRQPSEILSFRVAFELAYELRTTNRMV
jgi:hypothetical protein